MTSWTPESRSRQKTSDRARKWLKWALIALLSHSLGWASCHHLSYLSYLSSSQHPAASGSILRHVLPRQCGWPILALWGRLGVECIRSASGGRPTFGGTSHGIVKRRWRCGHCTRHCRSFDPWLNLAEPGWRDLISAVLFFDVFLISLFEIVKACESMWEHWTGKKRSHSKFLCCWFGASLIFHCSSSFSESGHLFSVSVINVQNTANGKG
jgi:hypothetical protein